MPTTIYMKIGLAYNIFDGEETFYASIKNMRSMVDYIVVMYQEISNFGNPISQEMKDLLEKIKVEKLADEIILHETILEKMGDNNAIKMNTGWNRLREVGCNIGLTMDTDEFYLKHQFQKAVKEFTENNYDSSYCNIQTYYGDEYSFFYDDYQVPFLYKIDQRNIKIHAEAHVLCDPKRKLEIEGKWILFDYIKMHHYSYIRKDYQAKFNNHCAVSVVKDNRYKVGDYIKNNISYEKGLVFIEGGEKIKEITLAKHKQPLWRCKRWIDIVAVTYGQTDILKCFINSIKAQTSSNWRLLLIHDGLNEELFNDLNTNGYLEKGKVEFIESSSRQGKYGHPNRALALQKYVSNEYVLLTNGDNYYTPTMVEDVLNCSEDFIYFDCVHSHKLLFVNNKGLGYGHLNATLQNSRIDMGCVVVKTDIAKQAGFNHDDFAADWYYFQEILKIKPRVKKINKILFTHN